MKHKVILLIGFLVAALGKVNAQSINVSDILSSSDQYIEMEYQSDGRIKILNQAARERFIGKEYKILVDKKGAVDLPNTLAALNFMYNIGYEVVLNYCSDIGSTNKYLLKKLSDSKKDFLPSKL